MAILYTALGKFVNNNYRFSDQSYIYMEDIQGNVVRLSRKNIKEALINKTILVSNLKLTSDNRLIAGDIEISERFERIIDIISQQAGVGHSKAYVNKCYFESKFDNTSIVIRSTIDDVNTYMVDEATKGSFSINSAKDMERAINILKTLKENNTESSNMLILTSDIIDGKYNNFKNNSVSIITTKNANQHYKLTINTNKELKIKIINNVGELINLIIDNSTINGLFIQDDNDLTLLVINACSINTLEVKEISYFSLRNSVIKEALYLKNNWIQTGNTKDPLDNLVKRSINYIKNIYVVIDKSFNDNISISGIIADSLNIASKYDCSITSDFAYINNIKVKAEHTVKIGFRKTAFRNMLINTNTLMLMSIIRDPEPNNIEKIFYNAYPEKEVSNTVVSGEINHVLDNRLHEVDNIIGNIEVDNDVTFRRFITKDHINRTFQLEEDKTNSLVLAKDISVDILRNIHYKEIKLESAIYFCQDSELSVDTLRISTRSEASIQLIDSSVTNFKLTILKNIVSGSSSNAISHMKKIIEELVDISKISKIRVLYGTQAYNVLLTNGAELEILNKQEINESVSNRVMKENLIGTSFIKQLEKIVRDTGYNSANEEVIVDLPHYNGVEIPSDILYKFYINPETDIDMLQPTSTIDIKTLKMIELMDLLPVTNLPFTKDIFNKITNDKNFIINTVALHKYQTIKIYEIYIAYFGHRGHDKYILVINGKQLLKMVYIGNGVVSSVKDGYDYDKCCEALSKLNSFKEINIEKEYIRQDMTTNGDLNDKVSFFFHVKKLFKNRLVGIYNYNNNTILTFDNREGKIIGFKFYYKDKEESLNKMYESLYDIKNNNYITITKIEKYDKIDDTLNDIKKQYENSILVRLQNNEFEVHDTADNVPEVQISSLWQIAKSLDLSTDNSNRIKIDLDTIYKILSLPSFTRIDESLDTIYSRADSSCKYDLAFNPVGDFRLSAILISSVDARKLIDKYNDFDKSTLIVYELTTNNGIQTYFSKLKIPTIVNYATAIQKYRDDFTTEKLYEASKCLFNTLLLFPSETEEADDLQECAGRVLNGTRIWIRKKHIPYYMFNPELSHEEQAEKLGDIGVSLNINDLDTITSIALLRTRVHTNKSSRKECPYIIIYETPSRYYTRGNGKRVNRNYDAISLIIIMCKSTGYLYLASRFCDSIFINFRIATYSDAVALSRQLDDDHFRKFACDKSLIKSLALSDVNNEELASFMRVSFNNIKGKAAYPSNYLYLATYKTDTPVYEALGNNINITNNIRKLNNANMAYIMHYINAGGLQVIPEINKSYKLINTYTGNDIKKIEEYYNSRNNKYQYRIDDMCIQSEYTLEELLDIG